MIRSRSQPGIRTNSERLRGVLLCPLADRVAVAPSSQDEAARAGRIAADLGLALVEPDDGGHDYRLVVTPLRLELRSSRDPRQGAVFVDWVGGAALHRRRFGGGLGQSLVRAVGVRRAHPPGVIDATAGLGRDAFVLASQGCRVTLLERSPVVALLLEDGLRRARADAQIGDWVDERMNVVGIDACGYLAALPVAERPDVVYLDPMYPVNPERKKSGRVKKEMRLFRDLVGEDGDAGQLLTTAVAVARGRVVVKRPRHADPLPGPSVSHCVQSKKTRFDVYLCPGQPPVPG